MRTLCSTVVLVLAIALLFPSAALAEDDTRHISRGSAGATLESPGVNPQPAFPEPPEAFQLDPAFSSAEAAEAVGGSCSGCSGWVYYKPRECWRYVSGSEERIFMYFQGNSNYAYIDTGDARHKQFIEACGNNHYIGLYWVSSSSFSNVRLHYY